MGIAILIDDFTTSKSLGRSTYKEEGELTSIQLTSNFENFIVGETQINVNYLPYNVSEQDKGVVFSLFYDENYTNEVDSADATIGNNGILNVTNNSLNYIYIVATSNIDSNIKAFLKLEKFTILSFIESTGSQYIDTSFIPNNNTRVLIDAMPKPGSLSMMMVRNITGTSVSKSFGFDYGAKVFRSFYDESYNSTSINSVYDTFNERRLYDLDKNIVKINGQTVKTNTLRTFTSTGTLPLFAMRSNNLISGFGTMRLYSAKIYDNGVLVRDFLPAKINSKIGLIDNLNNIFYENLGTSDFLI